MTINDKGRVPWSDKLRRVDAGDGHPGEWIAPRDVLNRVRLDYLSAVTWFQEAAMRDWAHLWSVAPMYLSGHFLRRYRALITDSSSAGVPDIVGVLRADHEVGVRNFSPDGARCLVIDAQSHRRMATYHRPDGVRISTQDLGSGVVVYRMAFDDTGSRWKVDALIQQLPVSGRPAGTPLRLNLSPALLIPAGRDF